MSLTGREKRPTKSLVVGRPILLALEDIDGGPSFLEKALRFLEKNGRCLLLGAFDRFCYNLCLSYAKILWQASMH